MHYLPIYGQAREEFWSKFSINKKIDNKWIVGEDLQYRSQENYQQNNKQRFQNPLLQSIRITLYYKIAPKYNIDLLASPLVYFRSFNVDKQANITDQREMRVALGAMQQQTLWKKIKLRNRLQYEMRFLKIDEPEQILQHRARWQIQMTMPICGTSTKNCSINYIMFNEVFFAHENRNTFHEQNRFYNALQIKYKWIDWNVGYQKSIQNVKGELVARNQLHFSANLTIE
ncbi:MAG: hypothetical protein OHK0045_12220 [Raineya sp.]